jgi:hypothetical protein
VSFDVTAASTDAYTVPSAPVSAAVVAAAAAAVSAADTSAAEKGVLSSPPQAAKDNAINDAPPARAVLEFFFSQAAVSFFTSSLCLVEASVSGRNAPVEIMFILLLHT